MSEVTLTVPAEYADDFRLALAYELREEATYVEKEHKDFLEEKVYRREDASDVDLRGAMKMLTRDAELFIQAGFEGDGKIEISIQDDVGAVPFAFETVARKIVGPHLMEALDCGPFDAAYSDKLHDLINRLSWAIDRAAEANADHVAAGKGGRV